MRHGLTLAMLGSALTLAGCGPKALALPADPIDKAATCAVVAAAKARTSISDPKAPLSLDQQGSILHYPLLAGAEGESFDQAKASDVSQRIPALQDRITKGKWQALEGPCAEAYPATKIADPKLPASPLEAQALCYQLASFANRAMADSPAYEKPLQDYVALRTKLDAPLAAALAKAGLRGKAADARRDRALADAARLGPPTRVMEACLARF